MTTYLPRGIGLAKRLQICKNCVADYPPGRGRGAFAFPNMGVIPRKTTARVARLIAVLLENGRGRWVVMISICGIPTT